MELLCMFLILTWCVLVVGWRLTQDFTSPHSPVSRYIGRFTYAGAILGWCVWGPSVASLLDVPELAIVTVPLGLVLGLLTGYVIGRLTTIFFFDEPVDDGPPDDEPHER